MARRLVIANKVYSSWSMRPWLLMRAFAIPFDEIVIPLDAPHAHAEILRHNPAGKVPVLQDGALVVWDSLAVVEHLAETHPDLAIWPRDPAARALARSLSAEMHSGFSALRRNLPMNLRRDGRPATLDAEAEAAVAADCTRIEAAWADARARFGANDIAPGPCLFGAFCAADAMFAPVINRFAAYAVPVTATSRAYMDAMRALPAWRDWETAALAEGWTLPRIDGR